MQLNRFSPNYLLTVFQQHQPALQNRAGYMVLRYHSSLEIRISRRQSPQMPSTISFFGGVFNWRMKQFLKLLHVKHSNFSPSSIVQPNVLLQMVQYRIMVTPSCLNSIPLGQYSDRTKLTYSSLHLLLSSFFRFS